MENRYFRPSLVKYGNSAQVIKGECGWGTENLTLDKTGATHVTRNRQVTTTITFLAGPWYEITKCEQLRVCSTDSDNC